MVRLVNEFLNALIDMDLLEIKRKYKYDWFMRVRNTVYDNYAAEQCRIRYELWVENHQEVGFEVEQDLFMTHYYITDLGQFGQGLRKECQDIKISARIGL